MVLGLVMRRFHYCPKLIRFLFSIDKEDHFRGSSSFPPKIMSNHVPILLLVSDVPPGRRPLGLEMCDLRWKGFFPDLIKA